MLRRPMIVSTHAPLAGRDSCKGCSLLDSKNFNPRAPCGARPKARRERIFDCISTHAPLAGRDGTGRAGRRGSAGFQPTRPLRGATGVDGRTGAAGGFQPTRPLRGATPRARFPLSIFHFNPRAPCGARPAAVRAVRVKRAVISTHAPLAGRDSQNGYGKLS